MTDYGMFHLKHIRPHKVDGTRFAAILRSCVKDCSYENGTCNKVIEDFCKSVISYAPVPDRPELVFLRFSNIGSNGQFFGNLDQIAALKDVTLGKLRADGMTVLSSTGNDDRYFFWYDQDTVERIGYRYCPDMRGVTTYVVLDKSFER